MFHTAAALFAHPFLPSTAPRHHHHHKYRTAHTLQCLHTQTHAANLSPVCIPAFPFPTPESQAYEISLGKLNKLLEDRTKYYENADVTIDLRGYGKDKQAGAPAAGTMGLWEGGVVWLGKGMAAAASLGLAARMWVLTVLMKFLVWLTWDHPGS